MAGGGRRGRAPARAEREGKSDRVVHRIADAELPEERWLLKADEVAVLLGLGRSKVFAMIWAHELPVVRLGRAVRVPRDRLIECIRERTAESMADAS